MAMVESLALLVGPRDFVSVRVISGAGIKNAQRELGDGGLCSFIFINEVIGWVSRLGLPPAAFLPMTHKPWVFL